jgi:hypothetical protein
MVFGFSGDVDKTLARADESIYDQQYRAQAEAFIDEAERRANAQGIRFRGADALSPRESIVDRPPVAEPWRACSRPLRLAYVTPQAQRCRAASRRLRRTV